MRLSGAEIDRDSRGGDNAIHTQSTGAGCCAFGEVYLIRRNPAPCETVGERRLVCMKDCETARVTDRGVRLTMATRW